MAGTVFISRRVKASWGLGCNQDVQGHLWAGKGYQLTLDSQVGQPAALAIATALSVGRGTRNGRFWIDMGGRIVTMMIGESAENKYKRLQF